MNETIYATVGDRDESTSLEKKLDLVRSNAASDAKGFSACFYLYHTCHLY